MIHKPTGEAQML